MGIEHRQERAPDVHDATDSRPDAGNPGSRQRRQDFSHNPCRGAANQGPDAEYDGVQNRVVSHLY
jgi:hypothetical protein